jgi:putative ABC transport system permease protein
MNYLSLSVSDLILASLLVLALGLSSLRFKLGIFRSLIFGAIRTTVQLTLAGWLLRFLFGASNPIWIVLMGLVMLGAASREVLVRQKRRFRGLPGFAMGGVSMFLSSFVVAILALGLMLKPDPWYSARYSIPLLGMLLGNTMNGVGLSLDRLTQGAWQQRHQIEGRLLLGMSWEEAIGPLRRESIQSGLIPVFNALAAAGLVSLPGMMTGQILAGAEPMEAVKYQILIMFLIAAGTGFGSLCAVLLGARRLFDERERLRLDRLVAGRHSS